MLTSRYSTLKDFERTKFKTQIVLTTGQSLNRELFFSIRLNLVEETVYAKLTLLTTHIKGLLSVLTGQNQTRNDYRTYNLSATDATCRHITHVVQIHLILTVT